MIDLLNDVKQEVDKLEDDEEFTDSESNDIANYDLIDPLV